MQRFGFLLNIYVIAFSVIYVADGPICLKSSLPANLLFVDLLSVYVEEV